MAFSLTTFTGDASTTVFSAGFPVVATDDITVTVDTVVQVEITDFTFSTFTNPGDTPTITFLSAPINGADIVIQRNTDISGLEAVFSNNSILLNSDLDRVNLQLLFSIQEADDRKNSFISTVGGNNTMNQELDMNLFRIINLATAVGDNDAIGKKQVEDLFTALLGSGPSNPFVGEGYQIGQTAFSAADLATLPDFTFVSRETTQQYLTSSFTEFDTATGSVYDIGGGFFELPAVVSPEAFHEYYTRLL